MVNREEISKGPEAFLRALERLLERGQGVSEAWRGFWEMELRRRRLPGGHLLPQWKQYYEAFAKAVDAFSEVLLEVEKAWPEEKEFPPFAPWDPMLHLPNALPYLRRRTAELLGILGTVDRNAWFFADLACEMIGPDWGTRGEDPSPRRWDDDMAVLAFGWEKYRQWWGQETRKRLRAALLGKAGGDKIESNASHDGRPTKLAKRRGRQALSESQQELYQKIYEAWEYYRRHTNNSRKDFVEETRGRFGELYETHFAPRKWSARAVTRALSWIRRRRALEEGREKDA